MKLNEQVVDAIFKELFEDNSLRYRQSLVKPVNNDTGIYANARNALAKLDPAEQDNVFKFIDLVIADSASVILGTLDGSHFPDNINGDFVVTYKDNEIQGSLQDLFIEKAEDKDIYS
ncbi:MULTISPECIES: hypothetical protein [Brenneria]|uniref:Uncharacterized protein n=1 Tax=Brenneria nigrifluens DSM 30175 = ATCC 13028 TaxID=1121120 RepID=A0A2U1UCN0_9GAMM|nr:MULTISPECIES: hypothetical protein [Brenneria]EHD20429.1 hypothetical protein BrE312_0995 [Brenneria sp. EniD312]PWC19362.1 hypothetical protein DDT54_22270 [Brenneria nigrifluens DSM 30175 = ATCC 13028]QCR03632.1 hypothetical protein EH206_05100 [Brenneria nigrifluens DSM 30175 = ATCC 13028]